MFAIAGGTLLLASLMFHVKPIARPDAFGVLLFLATIYIPERYRFSRASLIASALFGMLAFYTEPNFVLSLGITAIFLFVFHYKMKGIIYTPGSILVLITIALPIRIISECYFLDTIINNISQAGRSTSIMLYQLVYFGLVYLPIFLILGFIITIRKKKRISKNHTNHFDHNLSQKVGSVLDLTHIKMPLLSCNASLPWLAFIIATLAIIFILGRHLNNYVVYLFQIMTPFLLVGVFQYLNRHHRLYFISVPLVLINMYVLNYYVLYPNNSRPYEEEWYQLEDLIAGSERVLNSPAVAPMLIEMRIPVVDSGQSEYFY